MSDRASTGAAGARRPARTGGPGRAAALGRLLRISLFPSAVADVLAGLLVGGQGRLPGFAPTLALVGASLLVYHASLALNDWSDRDHDRRTRPDRPLPSGALPARWVPPAVALAYGAAVALAYAVAPVAGLWVLVLALLAALYDLRGRGPLRGPALLAACRGMNLGLGIVVAAPSGAAALAWVLPALYGAYVFTVSRLGRLEDGEDSGLAGGRPSRLLRVAAGLLILPAFVPLPSAGLADHVAALLLLALGAVGLLRRAREVTVWTPPLVGQTMGLALRRLLLFTAACCLLGGTLGAWISATLLLGLGYPLSRALSRRFPPS